MHSLTLGGVGYGQHNSFINDSALHHILFRLGAQLLRLSLVKLEALTSHTFQIVGQYCTQLTELGLVSCSNMIRLDLIQTAAYDEVQLELMNLMRAIGLRLTALDIRYSAEVSDPILRTLGRYAPRLTRSDRF